MNALGFIGVGNMGSALIKGICTSKNRASIVAHSRHMERVDEFVWEYGIDAVGSSSEVVADCEFLVIGVQPYRIDGLVDEIAPALRDAANRGQAPVFCSIAAGYPIAELEKTLQSHGLELPVVRIMPNSGVGIGKGICLFAANGLVTAERMTRLLELFGGTGLCESVPENVLEAAIPIFSCSPAYFYVFIEALADAGTELGLERDLAMRLATQAMYGSAAYAIESGKHPAQLREELATPGGMTITATNEMERLGFRASVIGGALKAFERSKAMR